MQSNKLIWPAALSALALALHAAPAQAGPSATEIVKKAWWAGKLDGSEMVSSLLIINAKGQQRVRKTAAISKLYDNGQTEKRLIRFLAPADVKGIVAGTIIVEVNYVPINSGDDFEAVARDLKDRRLAIAFHVFDTSGRIEYVAIKPR